VRWFQLDVLTGTAALGVLTSGGLDNESDNFRSSLLLSVPRPRGVQSSSSLLTTTDIPDNSDLAAPRAPCAFRASHDNGTVSWSQSSSSWLGAGGFDKARRNILCGDVKYGDSASDGGMGMFTGLGGRRREWLRPKPEPDSLGCKRGGCDGEGCDCIMPSFASLNKI